MSYKGKNFWTHREKTDFGYICKVRYMRHGEEKTAYMLNLTRSNKWKLDPDTRVFDSLVVARRYMDYKLIHSGHEPEYILRRKITKSNEENR